MDKPIKITGLEKFKGETTSYEVVDQLEHLLYELFLIRNPWTKAKKDHKAEFEVFKQEYIGNKDPQNVGSWFYFPWNKKLVRYLEEDAHQELKTARNKELITKDDQEKLYKARVSVAGLSVGSHGAHIMTMMGMAKSIKLADHDEISISNLNRLNYDYTQIGKNKAVAAAESIYISNPYAEIEIFSEGLNDKNISNFLHNTDIVIDEMDSLPMKIMVRKAARTAHLPVLMATDNGNSVILDVERFDIDPNHPIFHGRLELSEKDISGDARQTNPKVWNRIASEIIGIEFMETNLVNSLQKIGQTVSGVPQLGAAATMSGSLLALCVLKIVVGKPLVSGKYIFSTESILDPEYNKPSAEMERKEVQDKFRDFLNS